MNSIWYIILMTSFSFYRLNGLSKMYGMWSCMHIQNFFSSCMYFCDNIWNRPVHVHKFHIHIYKNIFYNFETSILKIKSYFYWKIISRSRKNDIHSVYLSIQNNFFFLLEWIGEVNSISQFSPICPVHSMFLHYILR